MTIYLYLKTHRKTGYKYLGKTIRNPYTYSGSGKLWTRHLNKYGNDVETQILFSTSDKKIFKKMAIEYSNKYNVVESTDFANLCNEEGQGGHTAYTDERNKKISKALAGRKNTWTKPEHNKGKIAAINKTTGETLQVTKEEFDTGDYVGVGTLHKGKKRKPKKPHSRVDIKVTCPHCHKIGAKNLMTRYHFDNCKSYILSLA